MMQIISHNGRQFRYYPRGGQLFIWDEKHPRRSAYHIIGKDGVTLACVVLKPEDRAIYSDSLDVAMELYKKEYA